MAFDETDIAAIRARAGGPVPPDYISYLETHGYKGWTDEEPKWFGVGDISGMNEPWMMDNLDEETDMPDGQQVLPIAGDYSGHGTILLEIAPIAGQVWFREDLDDPVLVASEFTAFINGLAFRPEPEPEVERWSFGTPTTDAAGFLVAEELRGSWKRYGSEPETEAEVAMLKRHLGRALPEDWRLFLLTNGAVFLGATVRVTWPGGSDGISSFYAPIYLSRQAVENPMPLALGELPDSEWLISLDDGAIWWRSEKDETPMLVAPGLRDFLSRIEIRY